MVKYNFLAEIPSEKPDETVVEKWDWNAVKNALDDSARSYLVAQNNFKEDHFLMNGRLIISTIGVLFSGYAIAYDWFHPFPESRSVLIACVILYFIMIGILTLWTSFLEKTCFASAKYTDGNNKTVSWKLSSSQKSDKQHIYVLEIEANERKSVHEASVAKYFDENGALVTKAFHADLHRYFSAFNSEEKKNK